MTASMLVAGSSKDTLPPCRRTPRIYVDPRAGQDEHSDEVEDHAIITGVPLQFVEPQTSKCGDSRFDVG